MTAEPPLTVPQSPTGLAPQRQNTTRSIGKLEVRLSTVLVAAAAGSLALGFILSRVNERLSLSRLEFPIGLLLIVLFPLSSLVGAVSALVFAVRRRRLQFVLELALAIAFLAYFATWESP